MKNLIRFSVIVMIFALVFCAAGCKKEKSAAATTQATQAPTQASEETATAPSEETVAATEATQTTETATEQTTATEPTTQENVVDVEDVGVPDEDTIPEDEFGVPPLITVTWETYESMTEAEKAAYHACFTTDSAFDSWAEMAYLSYEMEMSEEELWEYTSLNLKMIVEYLTGETFD